jgi:hypothetical protein
MMDSTWDIQMTKEELVLILRQVGVCQDHLENHYTIVLWHQSSDTKMVRDALKEENFKNISDFYWHKVGHKGNQIQRAWTPAVECATIAHYKSQNECIVRDMPADPRNRHNLIEVPHLTSFALNTSQLKINAAEKPRALAQFFVDHFCPGGGNVLVIGAGAGGDVFGALDGGANVVAVEKDPVQFNAFPATATKKLQVEYDKMEEQAQIQHDDDDTSSSASQASAAAPPVPQQGLQLSLAGPARLDMDKQCTSCGMDLTPDDIQKNIQCAVCEFKGPLCSIERFQCPRTDAWYCPEHRGMVLEKDSQEH